MKLSPVQIDEFEELGFLFIPEVFSAEEMELLNGELPGIFGQTRAEVIREKDSQAPRSAFHVQTWNPVFALLARHARLVEPGNRCDNAIRRFKRPTWIGNRDFTPIEILADDCLIAYARQHRTAAQ